MKREREEEEEEFDPDNIILQSQDGFEVKVNRKKAIERSKVIKAMTEDVPEIRRIPFSSIDGHTLYRVCGAIEEDDYVVNPDITLPIWIKFICALNFLDVDYLARKNAWKPFFSPKEEKTGNLSLMVQYYKSDAKELCPTLQPCILNLKRIWGIPETDGSIELQRLLGNMLPKEHELYPFETRTFASNVIHKSDMELGILDLPKEVISKYLLTIFTSLKLLHVFAFFHPVLYYLCKERVVKFCKNGNAKETEKVSDDLIFSAWLNSMFEPKEYFETDQATRSFFFLSDESVPLGNTVFDTLLYSVRIYKTFIAINDKRRNLRQRRALEKEKKEREAQRAAELKEYGILKIPDYLKPHHYPTVSQQAEVMEKWIEEEIKNGKYDKPAYYITRDKFKQSINKYL